MVVLTAAILLALGAPVNVRLECPDAPLFSAEASYYVGDANHAGFYVYAEWRIVLSPAVCGTLVELADRRTLETWQAEAWAGFTVFTLAHELAHAAGVTDETAADCRAAQTFTVVARMFPVNARRLMIASAGGDGYSPAAIAGCWPSLMPRAV